MSGQVGNANSPTKPKQSLPLSYSKGENNSATMNQVLEVPSIAVLPRKGGMLSKKIAEELASRRLMQQTDITIEDYEGTVANEVGEG